METKKCPYCGEEIKIVAVKCKHCGEFLEKTKSAEELEQKTSIPLEKEKIDMPIEENADLKNKKWYNKPWLVILLCLFIFPVGIYGFWKSSSLKFWWKIIISVIVIYISLVLWLWSLLALINIYNRTARSNSHFEETTNNSANNREPYSGNDYKYYTDCEFEVVTKKESTNSSLILVDKNGEPIKFDDEVDYSEYDIVEYAFYAQAVYRSANDHDCYGKYYFKDYSIVNQNINYVFNLPISNEIQNIKVKELFNQIYYDYKKYKIYNDDKGYGYQSFIMSDDGKKHTSNVYGFPMTVNPEVKLERNEDGNIQIYWIP